MSLTGNTPSAKKCAAQAEIDAKRAAFEAAGGAVQVIPRGQSAEVLQVKTDATGRQRWVEPQRKSQITVAKPKKKHRR